MSLAHNLEGTVRTKDILIDEQINFDSLLLRQETLIGLRTAGFVKPSPIQLKAIPLGKCGLDLIVKSKSGTGKTAVFGIIALEMVNIKKNYIQVVIIAPTREIAVQIVNVIREIGTEFKGLKVESFIGGLPLDEDIVKLQGCHIAVGAPGRMKHLIDKGLMKVDSARLFVLDEADKLMDESYQGDINNIFHQLPLRKQMITLSATYPDDLDRFLSRYMHSPTHVSPVMEYPFLLGLRQCVSVVKSNLNTVHQMNIKTDQLLQLLSKISFTQCLVFSNFQTRAESISNILNRKDWNTTFISAAQTQTDRLRAVNDLKEFKCRILVTTDLTARGIDAKNVDLVINYDIPIDGATYLHRMGRAGRYGSKGLCISIAAKGNDLLALQKLVGTIGGSNMTIAILPKDDAFPANLWDKNFSEFEQVSGVLNSDVLVNDLVDIKNSVLDMKSSDVGGEMKKKNVDDILENSTEGADMMQESNLSVKSNSVTSLTSNDDANDLLTRLAKGETIDFQQLDVGHSSPFKRKRDVKSDTNNDYVSSSRESTKAQSIYEKNVSLLNIARLLIDNKISNDMDCDNSRTTEKYLTRLKTATETALNDSDEEKSEPDKGCLLKGEVENSQLVDIFKNAYDYACKYSDIHWLDKVGTIYNKSSSSSCEMNVPDFEDDKYCGQEIDLFHSEEDIKEQRVAEDELMTEMTSDSGKFPRKQARNKKRNARKRKALKRNKRELDSNVASGHLNGSERKVETSHQVRTENYTPWGLYTEYPYTEIEEFTSHFDHYNEMLRNEGCKFNNVQEFYEWFKKWQQEIASVRDYIQQNIYLQEMNKYQHNKHNS